MHLDQKVSLKPLNTFGIEAEARYFVEAKTHSDLLTLLNYRHMIRMPILFMGGGSNLLFTGDFPGIVIRVNSRGIVIREENDREVVVTVEAGESWDDFVSYCIANGWAGSENLSLIPGTVGAAPIQNIGAYGVEVKDLVESVQIVEINSARQHRLTAAECRFGYRDSIFKQELKNRVIVLNVTFRLRKTGNDNGMNGGAEEPGWLHLEYGGIREELQRMEVDVPGIVDVRQAVCNIRRRKLPDPALIGNAGSFFKNPVVETGFFSHLAARHPGMTSFGQAETGRVKIPAAWLIEQCGWKGYREGDAGVHETQPLVLVNHGRASGMDILRLADRVADSVNARFGIRLEREVNVVA